MTLVHRTAPARRTVARAIVATALLCLGTSAAAQQTVNGDIIQMVLYDQGRADVRVKPSTAAGPADPYIRQYYAPMAFYVKVEGGTGGSFTGGYLGGTAATPVSNTIVAVPGGSKIVTIVDLGTTGLRLTQSFTYINGTRYITKEWLLENQGAVDHTDIRFFYGGDTYFGNNDSAYGFYDAANSMVYVRNLDTTNWGIMGFYANPVTPADHYFEGQYSTGNSHATSGLLPDTVNPSYVDAGYYLQWNRATLAAGASWTIRAFETWTEAGALQVLAPGNQNVVPNTTVTLPFVVQNLSTSPIDVSLSAASTQGGWTPTVLGGTSRTIAANSSASVSVEVGVPPGATGASNISLSATGGGSISTAATTLTVIDLALAISPSAIDFGAIAPGNTASHLVTITNNSGTTVTLGTLSAGSPFGTAADTCSGATLANLASCTVQATFSPVSPGGVSGSLSIPVTSPVLVTRTVALAGGITVIPTGQTYYFAEGATVWTFDTRLSIRNVGVATAPVTVTFLKEDGSTAQTALTILPGELGSIRVGDVAGMDSAGFATVVDSTDGVPLVVERTMIWDGGHGAHAGTATQTLGTSWYFAEGAQRDGLDTYVLLGNPGSTAADVAVTYLVEGASPITVNTTVGAQSRKTLPSSAVAGLAGRSFSVVLTSTQPIVAERSVYFGAGRYWDGGTSAMGVTAPAANWYFAEGATGPQFDMFVLLGNPGASTASVVVTFLKQDGTTVVANYSVPAQARHTIWVNYDVPGLANAGGVGIVVNADRPVLAERAMYWPEPHAQWREGHASAGLASPATDWAVAYGRVGGSTDEQSFLLLANPGGTASDVQVTYLRSGGLTPVVKNYTVAPTSRYTVWVNGMVPELSDEAFGATIAVLSGSAIVVEQANYWTIGGVTWAAGTVKPGTPTTTNGAMSQMQ